MVVPIGIGAAMGAMMLAMLHGPVMSGELTGGLAAAGFVGAHLALLVILGALLLFVPSLRRAVRRHRPDLRHAGMMLAGAGGTALVVHLWMHGVAT